MLKLNWVPTKSCGKYSQTDWKLSGKCFQFVKCHNDNSKNVYLTLYRMWWKRKPKRKNGKNEDKTSIAFYGASASLLIVEKKGRENEKKNQLLLSTIIFIFAV